MAGDHRRWLAYQVDRLRRAGHSQRQIAKALGIARRTVVSLLDELQQRRHDGESALEQVVPQLNPLPARPYDTRDVLIRVVDDYGRVQCNTNHYPVPAPPGSVVYACAGPARIELCDRRARRLIEYERLPDGARIKLDPPHVRRVRYDLDELVERVGRWGEIARSFAIGVREARRYAGPQLVRILQLQIDWSPEDIVAAMEQALAYRAFEIAKLQRILELRFSPRPYTDRIACATRQRIREVMAHHPVRQRPLSAYETLRRGDLAPERHADSEEDNDDGANRPPQATAGDSGDPDP